MGASRSQTRNDSSSRWLRVADRFAARLPTPERQKSCNSRATSHREAAGASGNDCDLASGRERMVERASMDESDRGEMRGRYGLARRNQLAPSAHARAHCLTPRGPAICSPREKDRNSDNLQASPHLDPLTTSRLRFHRASGAAGALPMGQRKAAFQIASTRSVPLSWGNSTTTRAGVCREATHRRGCLWCESSLRSARHADCSALRTCARPAAAGRLELIEEVA
jgi:hypothetical protein